MNTDKTTNNPLTFRYALLCLIGVGGIFYASYGLSNYLASQQTDVADIFFEWEKSIPFLAWTIVPYWSLNVFYALAFFLCKNRDELRRYIKQLLFVQCVAVLCFLLFPLQFSWQKPDTDGVFAFLFNSLASFDKPYNQAPSLHIALSVIIGNFFWHKLSGIWKTIWTTWVLLIALSVLTTYQHHFIDIPTGFLLGLLAIWMLPAPKQCIFQGWHTHLTTDKNHQRWTMFYLTLSIFFAVLASTSHSIGLWLFYPAVSCLIVASAYAFWGVGVLQKQESGRLRFSTTVLLLPYLLGVRLNIWFWLKGNAKSHRLIGNVSVGSITVAKQFNRVIDMCGEYPCLAKIEHYRCLPLLDRITPTPITLCHIADEIEKQYNTDEPVLVCCALGYERSVSAIVTWLVRYQHCATVDEAIGVVKQSHTKMVLSDATRMAIEQAIGKIS